MSSAAQPLISRQDFIDGPIPNGYAKVIDIGPEGETNEPRIMPADVACREWGQTPPKQSGRLIILVHPWGITTIRWDDIAGAVQTTQAA